MTPPKTPKEVLAYLLDCETTAIMIIRTLNHAGFTIKPCELFSSSDPTSSQIQPAKQPCPTCLQFKDLLSSTDQYLFSRVNQLEQQVNVCRKQVADYGATIDCLRRRIQDGL